MAKKTEFVFDEKNVTREISALKKVFKPVLDEDEGKQAMLLRLIEEASFMKCVMKECRRRMLAEELVTEVRNGSQHYMKENPSAKIYSDNCRQYKDYVKTLIEYLPPKERKSKMRELLNSD